MSTTGDRKNKAKFRDGDSLGRRESSSVEERQFPLSTGSVMLLMNKTGDEDTLQLNVARKNVKIDNGISQ
jgi:hypothetical protein